VSSFVDLQLRTEATSAEYDVSDERKAELTAALEGIGSSNVEIGYEVTFPLVAENGPRGPSPLIRCCSISAGRR
jgi:hypothetical protein